MVATSMEPLMTRAEVAAYLGVPIQTLAVWASQSKGPEYHRVGRHTRYRRTAVDAWLAKHASSDTKPAA